MKDVAAENATIKDLKKNDAFLFNGKKYIVTRKWINEDKPLVAQSDSVFHDRHRFEHEGLQILKLL